MLRALALIFWTLAAGILATDLVSNLMADGTLRLAALGEWWVWIHRDSLLMLQPAVERHISPALWDPGIQTLLEWPAALEIAALGGLFWLAARWRRRTRRRIGSTAGR